MQRGTYMSLYIYIYIYIYVFLYLFIYIYIYYIISKRFINKSTDIWGSPMIYRGRDGRTERGRRRRRRDGHDWTDGRTDDIYEVPKFEIRHWDEDSIVKVS